MSIKYYNKDELERNNNNLKLIEDFIERATLKDGSNFVTRKAPAVGNNNGGGIEIVTTKDSVNIESHTTLD